MGNGATDGDRMGAAEGDDCSQVGTDAVGGMRSASTPQPTGRDVQGNDKAVINSDASGKRLDSGAAAGDEPVPLQADLDSRQGEVSSERVVQESRTEGSCMPGCDREQQAAEERAATPPVERYFGVVDQMDGPHDNVAHMVAKLCWRGSRWQ